jgi:FlaA1/EpsC-like NDP-sugar epimerase
VKPILRIPIVRSIFLVLADGATAAAALAAALYLRFDGLPADLRAGPLALWLLLLAAARMAATGAFGVERWSFRFSGLTDALRVGLAGLAGTLAFCGALAVSGSALPPKGALVTELLVALSAMLALRFVPRLVWIHRLQRERVRDGAAQRAIIAGAGAAGELLLRDLARSRDHSYLVLGFVDDDQHKQGTVVAGRPVFGPLASLPEVVRRHRVELVLIAIPHLPAARLRELLSMCSSLQVRFKMLPLSHALALRSGATQLKSLAPEDLLPRAEVRFSATARARLVAGRAALVTGAAGSIGRELARQLLEAGVRSLVLVDQDENGLYLLQRELAESFAGREIVAEVANVRDLPRLTEVLLRWRPQDLLHAAAHKQVPLLEEAPAEAVKSNVVGTRNAVAAATSAGVERFLLISTDKAVRPTSVMGASKRVAELVVLHAAGALPRPCVVRFGNVLGSAGSVVPLFQRQIEDRRPVTVTHPEVQRYFMTVSEAVGLVLEAMYNDVGEVCTLEMGEPMRVLDLARHMITMAGLVPDVDIPIVFTGLRPGEKMTEDLFEGDEERRRHESGVMVTSGAPLPLDFEYQLQRLIEAAAASEHTRVRHLLGTLVPSFQPGGTALGSGDGQELVAAAQVSGATAASRPPQGRRSP